MACCWSILCSNWASAVALGAAVGFQTWYGRQWQGKSPCPFSDTQAIEQTYSGFVLQGPARLLAIYSRCKQPDSMAHVRTNHVDVVDVVINQYNRVVFLSVEGERTTTIMIHMHPFTE